MRAVYRYSLILLLLLFAGGAWAEECIVINGSDSPDREGSLAYFIKKVAENGDCVKESFHMRERYGDYIKSDGPFHVIRIDRSADIYSDGLPPLTGKRGNPLVIVASEWADAKIIGNINTQKSGITIQGGGGPVVVDNITIEGFGRSGVEIDSDRNLLVGLKIGDNGLGSGGGYGVNVTGKENAIIDTEISGNGGDGIVIGKKMSCSSLNPAAGDGDSTIVETSVIKDNGKNPMGERDGFGLFINADEVTIGAKKAFSTVKKNRLAGIYIESAGRACEEAESENRPRRVMISKVAFDQNGSYKNYNRAIAIAGRAVPPAAGVANIADSDGILAKIVGNIPIDDGSGFWIINPNSIEVEIYKANGSGEPYKYLATAEGVSKTDGSFTVSFNDGDGDAKGQLTAVVLDFENWQTSAPNGRSSNPGSMLSPTSDDADGDGLSDAEEGSYSTNPLDPDTDGDGLTDGEEVHLSGLVAIMAGRGRVITRPDVMNPKNPDSDGDCLPDGLEFGVTYKRLNILRRHQTGRSPLALNPRCAEILRTNTVSELTNAIWLDPAAPHMLANASVLFDLDPSTATDPSLADTDNDGMDDGLEDWNFNGKQDVEEKEGVSGITETDPLAKDSDEDKIIDGDEGDRNGNGKLDEFESSPVLKDTDDDGVEDGEEERLGTNPNSCDSDDDKLPDGIEAGVIHPNTANPNCRGLQSAGSNFAKIDVLDPASKDSDADGIKDGDEDANQNGWLDPLETDPTVTDTDDDGIDDYVETTGDLDADGKPDIDPYIISNGSECSPPASFTDVDCDGLPNAVDADSDDDGCPDRQESISNDANMDGIPDTYDSKSASCGSGVPAPSTPPSIGGGSSGSGNLDAGDEPQGSLLKGAGGKYKGGGACSLGDRSYGGGWLLCLIGLLFILCKKAKKANFFSNFFGGTAITYMETK